MLTKLNDETIIIQVRSGQSPVKGLELKYAYHAIQKPLWDLYTCYLHALSFVVVAAAVASQRRPEKEASPLQNFPNYSSDDDINCSAECDTSSFLGALIFASFLIAVASLLTFRLVLAISSPFYCDSSLPCLQLFSPPLPRALRVPVTAEEAGA